MWHYKLIRFMVLFVSWRHPFYGAIKETQRSCKYKYSCKCSCKYNCKYSCS
ncbi:hypothetical protein YPIP275_1212 [Yersinia pestis biovar Orientalis str. IP275]|uniref:Uncharacterized protein n=1 Tax=Yersinia pestis biovar Orientalis str. IP275 TaxID=373665 RepID=A0AAV3BD19_YERPE|nr:hypothetical protein YPIP275_1212 [Yersinia pestis biovar Orientalis str. IP275]